MDEVKLTVPAMPQHLHLLRAVVSSVAARENLSLDAIDDLQLAVDEAASFMLDLPDAEELCLSVGFDAGKVVARLTISSGSDWPPPGATESLAWKVMEGLTDEAAFAQEQGRNVIRLAKSPDADGANDG